MQSWKRTYRVVWAANLVTSIGMMSFLPFFPSLLEEIGVEGDLAVRTWAGILFGAAPLGATIMSPIWGAIGDRYGRKLMVCRAMFAIALFVGAMAFATSPWQLLALRLGQGIFSGFIPPSITLVSVGAPADRQGRVAGSLTTALAIGGMIGPVLGGWLALALGGRQAVFFVVGGAALASGVLVWLFAHEERAPRATTAYKVRASDALRGVLADVREVLANPAMRAMALLIFAAQFGLGAVNPVLELYVREIYAGVETADIAWLGLASRLTGADLSRSEDAMTFATSLLFGGMALANLLALRRWGIYGDRVGHRRALLLCAAGCAVALWLQAAAAVFAVLLLGRILTGVAMAGIGPLAFGLAAGEVDANKRGGAFGLVFSARTLAVAVGAQLGGWLSGWIGIRALMVVAGLLIAGVLVAFARARTRAATGTGSTARP